MVVAFRVDASEWGKDHGAEEGQADLAAVGVAGEDEVDELCAGVLLDGEGVVRLVCHEDDGCAGFLGDSEIEVGVAGAGILHSGEPDAGTVPLQGEVAVDEDGDSVALECVDYGMGAYAYVVVAEDREAQWAGEGGEELGAAVGGVGAGDEGEGADGDKVSGDEDDVWVESVDAADDFAEEVWLGELVEVNVTDLDDAIAVEGVREVANGDGTFDDVDLVAAYLAGIEGESCG